MHELLISRGRTGYLALYEYVEPLDGTHPGAASPAPKRATRMTSGRSSLVEVSIANSKGSREGL